MHLRRACDALAAPLINDAVDARVVKVGLATDRRSHLHLPGLHAVNGALHVIFHFTINLYIVLVAELINLLLAVRVVHLGVQTFMVLLLRVILLSIIVL